MIAVIGTADDRIRKGKYCWISLGNPIIQKEAADPFDLSAATSSLPRRMQVAITKELMGAVETVRSP